VRAPPFRRWNSGFNSEFTHIRVFRSYGPQLASLPALLSRIEFDYAP
jgi:hypothetical protein